MSPAMLEVCTFSHVRRIHGRPPGAEGPCRANPHLDGPCPCERFEAVIS